MLYDLFNELVWLMLAAIVLIFIAARYWSNPLTTSLKSRLKDTEQEVVKLKKVSESLTVTIQDLQTKLQKQLETAEYKVTQLNGDLGEVRRETKEIDKQIDSVEAKIDLATTKIDSSTQQVNTEIIEIKHIDEQVKDNANKIKSNAHNIHDLEEQVRKLQRERNLNGNGPSHLR